MLGWMFYATVVGALLAGAAWMAERSAETRKASTRLYWSLAILASLILPVAMASVSIQAPSLTNAVERAPPSATVPLRQMTSIALTPTQWIGDAPASPNLNRILIAAWALTSAALAAGILTHAVLLYRRKRRWRTARVAGVEVFVSKDVGPAVVGLVRPRIVVPSWIATAPAENQALIIAHERSHLDADDARLLAIAILLIVGMPWNLPLWWQLRRLRLAIEVDGLTCKAPVLDRLPDLAELLAHGEDEAMSQNLRRAESIGRPLGAAAFIDRLEAESGRTLRPGKRGPKPQGDAKPPADLFDALLLSN